MEEKNTVPYTHIVFLTELAHVSRIDPSFSACCQLLHHVTLLFTVLCHLLRFGFLYSVHQRSMGGVQVLL